MNKPKKVEKIKKLVLAVLSTSSTAKYKEDDNRPLAVIEVE